MVGLEYEVLASNVTDQEQLDEDIENGDLDYGSHYYDSGYDENIIGFDVAVTDGYTELNIESFLLKTSEATMKFVKRFPGQFPKLYVTMNVT